MAEIPAIRVATRPSRAPLFRAAVVAAGLGLSGCATPGPMAPPVPPAGQVNVAPGIAFSLLAPATLGRTVEAAQLVTARYQNETFVFETRISVTPARLLIVGTDMMGRRAMTIEWAGDTLKVEAAPWVPARLSASNVIADIMLLHWPENAVRAGLMPKGLNGAGATPRVSIDETKPGHRVITVDGRDMISIDRIAGAPGSWNGRWTYRNDGWDYGLDIQSTETAP